ncbi:MAG: DUF1778 domain-containing protein [Coriobacteriales bacterium]|nr:DUF1778 domain-containing protein [Coriobacteriales bacterium]
MANSITLSIKTDPETKAIIQRAAERIGLSTNSFVLMVAKNAAESDEIVIRNTAVEDLEDQKALERALDYNREHQATMGWEEMKAHYGI